MGSIPEPSHEHPQWCDRVECGTSRDETNPEHRSTPIEVEPPAPGDPLIRLWVQSTAVEPVGEAPVLVVVEVDRTPVLGFTSVESYALPPAQYRALIAALSDGVIGDAMAAEFRREVARWHDTGSGPGAVR